MIGSIAVPGTTGISDGTGTFARAGSRGKNGTSSKTVAGL